MANDVWAPIVAELDRWQSVGKIARFWLRDDDAVEPTPELDRLLAIAERHATPLTLAVIPAHTDEALARHLHNQHRVNIAVHGWSHTNHAGQAEKSQELGRARPIDTVLGELAAGFERLETLYPKSFTPILVPPWNRIDPAVIERLEGIGFKAFSVFGPEKSAPLPMINTHVDLIDWRGTRGGRDHRTLIADIIQRLHVIAESSGAMGFLTHHLIHDEQAWRFTEELLAITSGHPACQWVALPRLLEEIAHRKPSS